MSIGKITAIAAKDLKSSLVSFKAWSVIFFFLIFMGIFFFNYIDTYVSMQNQAPDLNTSSPSIEQLIYAIFSVLHFVLILVIPALTMGTFAEEKKNQTLILLQSSPLSTFEIIMGKFFAVICLMTFVLAGSSIYIAYLLLYGNPDPFVIASSYLGFFLLIATHLAFGIWISTLCKNQFLAFIFSMLGLFFLLIINALSGSLKGDGLGPTILKYLGTSDHIDSFLKGVISTADISYFLCMTVLFLFFAAVSYDIQRWR